MARRGLIAVAGVVGVGKTTLAEKLAEILPGRLIREEYDQNPFLARQLAGDGQAGFASELFFLFSRARQLNLESIKQANTVVCDYIFHKNRIFAEMNLDAYQWAIFDELEKTVKSRIAVPQTVVYLHDTVDNCLARILHRGREYEKAITAEWLSRLSLAYDALLNDWHLCPVMRIDCCRWDIRQAEIVQRIAERIHSECFVMTETMA